MKQSAQIAEIRQLITRLERLSVDSRWAHRAAGLRGGLINAITVLETGRSLPEELENWVAEAYKILFRAAKEIRGDDS